jgi:hypothetical protein
MMAWPAIAMFDRYPRIGFAGGNGFHWGMICTQRLASALSVIRGKQRRSSTTADNSPPCRRALRIAAAAASSTANIPSAWGRPWQGANSPRGDAQRVFPLAAPHDRDSAGATGRMSPSHSGPAQARHPLVSVQMALPSQRASSFTRSLRGSHRLRFAPKWSCSTAASGVIRIALAGSSRRRSISASGSRTPRVGPPANPRSGSGRKHQSQ